MDGRLIANFYACGAAGFLAGMMIGMFLGVGVRGADAVNYSTMVLKGWIIAVSLLLGAVLIPREIGTRGKKIQRGLRMVALFVCTFVLGSAIMTQS